MLDLELFELDNTMKYTLFCSLLLLVLVQSCKEVAAPETFGATRKDSTEQYKRALLSAEECKACHPRHYEEWKASMHAYAIVDPVFTELNKLGQQQSNGALGSFCINCHAPFASLLNEVNGGFFTPTVSKQTAEGVNCDGCHKIESFDIGHGITKYRTDGVQGGNIKDPVFTPFHASAYDKRFENGDMCLGCHDVVNPRGFRVEQTSTEWQHSFYPERGITCQTCHMKFEQAPIAVGGPVRTYHSHLMEGVDVPLVDFPGRDLTIEKIDFQLKYALTMNVLYPENHKRSTALPLTVELYNDITGHNVPTGAIYDRQMWLEVVATNKANGDTLLATGLLDPNGDLCDAHSEYVQAKRIPLDTLLKNFTGTAYRHGKETSFFFDADAAHNRSVPPRESRFGKYSISANKLVGVNNVNVRVRLRFRSFPPYLLRSLGRAELVSKLPIFEMEEYETTISLQ